MEKIANIMRGPKWKPTFSTKIANERNEALEEIERENSGIQIYMDGSAIEEGVGASAILYMNGSKRKVARKYLGPSYEHTVFKAELMGAIMGIKMLMHENAHSYTISTDNQAAITTTHEEKGISGQYLVQALHRQAEVLKAAQHESQLVIRWVPGHEGIEGNERADTEAKEAARNRGSREEDVLTELQGTLPVSKVAENLQQHNELHKKAKRDFTTSLRAHNTLKIHPSMPSLAYYKMTREKSRQHTSLMVHYGQDTCN